MADMAGSYHWLQIAGTALISSGMGGVIGGLVAWGGIRIRLDHLEKKMGQLSRSVVYKDVCDRCAAHAEEKHRDIQSDIREIKIDIKELLKVNGVPK